MIPEHWMASVAAALLVAAFVLKSLEASRLRRDKLAASSTASSWRDLAIRRGGQLQGNTPLSPRTRRPSFYLNQARTALANRPVCDGTIQLSEEDLLADDSAPDWSDDFHKTTVLPQPFKR